MSRSKADLELPWDLKLALNLAFNRTFSTPTVAAVLACTGELTERTHRRVDDTALLMFEIVLHGFEHPRGRAAIRRMNQLHRPHRGVPAEEFVYVLACLTVVPLRWLDRYGWRRPCCHEREATYRFYRELGEHMDIAGIPDSLASLERWFDEFDRTRLRPDAHAAAIEREWRTPHATDESSGCLQLHTGPLSADSHRPALRCRAWTRTVPAGWSTPSATGVFPHTWRRPAPAVPRPASGWCCLAIARPSGTPTAPPGWRRR
ncbi:oxygenase MpaB family protein [Asanoa sp. NPDC049518]|uniref:oxygenase MpaB family protein n=1 Tax=unclassified Asanoa TaxID=2685164 RepID=UPI0034320BAA